jgi:hypothetical protein
MHGAATPDVLFAEPKKKTRTGFSDVQTKHKQKRSKRSARELPPDRALDLCAHTVLTITHGGIAGAKTTLKAPEPWEIIESSIRHEIERCQSRLAFLKEWQQAEREKDVHPR